MNNDNYKPTAPEAQLGGAKRKNGHKLNCSCHICENMKNKAKRGGYEEDAEKEKLKKMGGSKKKNGHKPDCQCPICKNMRNASKDKKEMKEPQTKKNDKKQIQNKNTGTKKSNGHKIDCGCPICKNMQKNKNTNNNRLKGGEEPDIENQIGDIEEGKVKGISDDTSQVILASDDEYDELDAAEKGEAGLNTVGGTRKRRSLKSKKPKGTKKNRRNKKRPYKK